MDDFCQWIYDARDRCYDYVEKLLSDEPLKSLEVVMDDQIDSIIYLPVVTEKNKQNVLEGCHCAELGGGHFGRDKTLSKIAERRGMVDDVKEFCKTCDKCQRANRTFDKTSAELHPIPVKREQLGERSGAQAVARLILHTDRQESVNKVNMINCADSLEHSVT
ncbi:hypothetical protein EMCRGX_G009551 [Ephydatia muelleri]